VGADLVHNLGDGESSEILLKKKCRDNVVSCLGERLKDFPNNFLLVKVSNIESIDSLNKHTHPRIHLFYTLIILHFELIKFHLEQLIFLLTDLFVTHMDFFEVASTLHGWFPKQRPDQTTPHLAPQKYDF
jgi:hypothetical protein